MKKLFGAALIAAVFSCSISAWAQVPPGRELETVALDTTESLEKISPSVVPATTPGGSASLTINTTKIGIPEDRVGSYVSVVTREQIRRMQATSLLEVLQRLPGVDVVQNGGLGNSASIFIRGMNAEHTLVLMNGIEMNDPISPGRTFNFPDQISLDAVERIEVLRGPQSTLYGSDAIGGVINIITEPENHQHALYGRVQAGSYGTVLGDMNLQGALDAEKIQYDLHASRHYTNGFSAAGSRYGNQERDDFDRTSLLGQLKFQPINNASLSLFSQYADSVTDLDNFGGYGGDDPNYRLHNKTLQLGARSKVTLLNGAFEQTAQISTSNLWRRNRNQTDPLNLFDSERSQFNSQLLKLDIQNNFRIHPGNTVTFGFEAAHERGDLKNEFQSLFGPSVSEFQQRSATNLGYYLQDYIELGNRWFTTLGIRADVHNRFGHALTYRAASTYLFPETGTSLKASIGTGFKAPTLYQLYSPYGTANLQPERSLGWDFGMEQAFWKGRIRSGATYFHNSISNIIQFDPGTFLYENTAKVRTLGTEAYVDVAAAKWLSLRASYSYIHTRDLESHEALLRRPRHKMAINVHVTPIRKLSLDVDLLRLGAREDLDFASFPASRVKLVPYTLLNLAINYQLTDRCSIFGRLANLLDVPYENVKGYGSPRLSAYGGLQFGI